MPQAGEIAAEFDRIARAGAGASHHNAHYHPRLLRQLPERLGAALDLGCGTGAFSRLLAARAECVVGLDLSAEMLTRARAESADFPNLRFEQQDFLRWQAPPGSFDAIVSIATLHHLPLVETLARLRDLLAPGGTLVVLDLVRDATPLDFARSALAVPLNLWRCWHYTGALREPAAVRAAWDAHIEHDRYASLAELRAACAVAGLAGARIQRLLCWRYILLWHKPA